MDSLVETNGLKQGFSKVKIVHTSKGVVIQLEAYSTLKSSETGKAYGHITVEHNLDLKDGTIRDDS